MREWKDLFVAGMPLYEVISEVEVETTQDMLLEEERQRLLDEGDFLEYKVGGTPVTSTMTSMYDNDHAIHYLLVLRLSLIALKELCNKDNFIQSLILLNFYIIVQTCFFLYKIFDYFYSKHSGLC